MRGLLATVVIIAYLAFMAWLAACHRMPPQINSGPRPHVTIKLPLDIPDTDDFCVEQPYAAVPWHCLTVEELRTILRQVRKADP